MSLGTSTDSENPFEATFGLDDPSTPPLEGAEIGPILLGDELTIASRLFAEVSDATCAVTGATASLAVELGSAVENVELDLALIDECTTCGAGEVALAPDADPLSVDLSDYAALLENIEVSLGVTAKFQLFTQGCTPADPVVTTGFTVIVEGSSSLPAELVAFAARAADEAVAVSWRTASEQGVSRFAVERSTPAADFTEVASVPAANAASGRDYSVSVPAIREDGYFRLRTIDYDGSASVSELVFVPGSNGVQASAYYPNPARPGATIRLAEALNYDLQLLDPTGRSVVGWQISGRQMRVPADLPAGFYTLRDGESSVGRYLVIGN